MHVVPFAGLETPDQAAACLAEEPGLAWLDGNVDGRDGRWSFVGANPISRVRIASADPLLLRGLDLPPPGPDVPATVANAPAPAEVPRWVGWIAYDAHRPARLAGREAIPHAAVVSWARYDALVAFDHASGARWIVGDDADACARLAARLSLGAVRSVFARVREVVVPDPAVHVHAIEAALEHIARGDIYQVNLARRWTARLEGSPLALFLAMRKASPVPLGFFLDDGHHAVLSRSMERFLRWDAARGELVTRPIKGTMSRAGGQDTREKTQLRDDPKERAEHAMIVDLMRNDLGRVARVGTVEVVELMAIEPYAGLHHMVSTIRCRTSPEATWPAIVAATFPPGSVTGTPKARAMEIIDALEPHAREVYTGAVGFVDRAGGLSLAVAIRTAVVARGEVRYWAGGGIVEASRPDRELAETELKARAFLDALPALAAGDALALSRGSISR